MYDATRFYKAKNNIKKLEANNETVITGFLEVSVLEDKSNLPISDAEVSIYRFSTRGVDVTQGEEVLIVSYTTDEDGKIPIVELPVIHGINDETDFERIQYHMAVSAFGYNSVIVINIEIFPNITTVYYVRMAPMTMGVPRNEFVIIPEKH